MLFAPLWSGRSEAPHGRKLVSGYGGQSEKKGLPYGFTMLNANLLFFCFYYAITMLCYAIL